MEAAYLIEWDDGNALCELASLQQSLGCLVAVNHHLTRGTGRTDKQTKN
jgi:hypothetical protein